MKRYMTNCVRNLAFALLAVSPLLTMAQQPKIQGLRPYDQTGINVFEPKKDSDVKFDGVKVRFGAGFTQQAQSLKHSSTSTTALYPRLAPGFGIAQANLYMDVQLADGITMNVTTYLSARHHNESWVKGGYIQMQKLPLKGEFFDKLMKNLTVKVGHYEVNYGDAHFRRSDGGHTLYNPFIENYILDEFATEVAAEVYYQKNEITVMGGLSNGLINGGYQTPVSGTTEYKRGPSVYGKVAYDKQVSEKVRVRGAASLYHNNKDGRSTLFQGDRTGSNYFFVLEPSTATAAANPYSGRISNLSFSQQVTAAQFNLFAKAGGFELFGTYEAAKGRTIAEKLANSPKREISQFAVDGVYRIGKKEELFLGVRYNTLNGQMLTSSTTKQTVDRVAFAAGWFVAKNLLLKGEYVSQKYSGFPTANVFNGGKFNGVVLEAVVGF
ncbi:MAG: hypothetical protein QM725_05430 [Lacibacter sp.]